MHPALRQLLVIEVSRHAAVNLPLPTHITRHAIPPKGSAERPHSISSSTSRSSSRDSWHDEPVSSRGHAADGPPATHNTQLDRSASQSSATSSHGSLYHEPNPAVAARTSSATKGAARKVVKPLKKAPSSSAAKSESTSYSHTPRAPRHSQQHSHHHESATPGPSTGRERRRESSEQFETASFFPQ
jgi:hypothetical protein